jgi:enoyl-CoA hydratase
MPESGQDAFQEIRYTIDGQIAEIQLNVPDKRNRLSFLMRREIVHALRLAESDDRVSIVLITGSGPSFCAGYDLAAPRPAAGQDTVGQDGEPGTEYYRQRGTRPDGWVASEHFDNWTDQFARSCVRDWLTIWDLLKPVIAMVQGHCVAGGTELMSMCDISFAADDARIGYPPMRGMTSPDVPYFAWKLSMAQAKYLQLTGNSVTGAEAAQMGWISKSFPADKLREETMRELVPMSHISPALLSANKQQVNQAYELMGMRTHLQSSWQYHVLSGSVRPGADRFGSILRSEGLHAALEWRDGQFRAAGLA